LPKYSAPESRNSPALAAFGNAISYAWQWVLKRRSQ